MRRSRILTIAVLALAILAIGAGSAAALPTMPSSAFQPWTGCGCHPGMVQSWSKTMHAQALTDPLYRAKFEEGDKATGGALGPFCNACHGPVAIMSGELVGLDASRLSPSSADAISCDFCHHVTGTDLPMGNTSQQVSPDPTKRARFSDSVSPAHATAYSAFHETAEFCGSCHDVNHPGNGLPLEATYTEWKNGPYAPAGVVCQDCHMTPGPGVNKSVPGKAAAMGPQRPFVYSMVWVGGNAALGPKTLAEQRLRAAAQLDLSVPAKVDGGASAPVSVRITNVGAGHYLPTGLTEVRQMWLEVTATDAEGKQVLEERRDFGTVLADAEGKHPVELWDATAIHSDDRIPPQGSVESTYALAMPASGPVAVKAALYYRSASEEFATKAKVEVPTTLMASTSRTVYTSDAERAAARDERNRNALRRVSSRDVAPLALAIAFVLALIGGAILGSRSRRAS